MNEDKQIDDIARILCRHYQTSLCNHCGSGELCDVGWSAEVLFAAGYRKQSEGEWILEECQCGLFGVDQYFVCSACKQEFCVEGWDYEDLVANVKFCPNCGAKMKGGDGK